MAKRPRRTPPARCPGNPGFSAPQRTKPRVLKTLLKTSQNFPPRFPLIFPSPAPKVLHKNPVTGKNNQANAASRRGAGFPGHQRKGHGDAGRTPARLRWAGADWAHKDGHATKSCGGSRGPVDPWSAAAASKRRGEALERLCREIAQRCADGRSDKRARSSVSGRRTGGQCKRAGALPFLYTVTKEQRKPQVLIFFVISSTISLRCRSLPIFFSIVLMEYTTVE